MAKISKYVKLDKNILLEYIYNDGNLISEPYNILVNSRDRNQSYIAFDTSGTGNTQANQLFRIDPIQGRWGKVNPDFYSFLQVKNYSAPSPIRHDTIKVHLPINWTFGEYLGFYVRVYTFDSLNQKQYELSNFYFDMTDVSQQYLLNFTSPPLLFQEKLWGKNVEINIPAVSEISAQLTDNRPTANSINANLTGGIGLSLNSPVFIDFHFIKGIQTINAVTTYLLEAPVSTAIPQTPEFERLGLVIENSENGDFFEIYGTYNDTIAGFKKFIDDSVAQDKRYYVQYNITMYEQNIRGKTTTITVTDSFNESIEYRPIIKYSTTTAIIDVEMRLIDAVDDSYIIRRASYGMLQDEVSKYSLRLMKINLSNAAKPKVYNIKNAVDPALVGVANSMGMITINSFQKLPPVPGQTQPSTAGSLTGNESSPMSAQNGVSIQQVRVPFPVLVDRFNIIARSENAVLDTKNFYGFGKIQIILYPFDNIVKFRIARGTTEQPEFFDLTGFSEIKITIKNDSSTVSFPLFVESGEVDLVNGSVVFKITQNKFQEIKRIYTSGVNVFYITGTNASSTNVIYTGLYKIYDDKVNVSQLNDQASNVKPTIILDNSAPRETAIVTRRPAGAAAPSTSGNAPKAKPTANKDIIQNIGKIKRK